MRKAMLTGGMLVLLPFLLPGAATAQNYDPTEALSTSRLGTTSCAAFTAMRPGARDSLVRRIANAAPARSLSTLSVDPTILPNGQTDIVSNNPSTVPGTPLTAGQLIAACQTVAASATLHDAFTSDRRLTSVDF